MARAAPDGHTVLLGYIGTHGISPALQRLHYDQRDTQRIGAVDSLLVGRPGLASATHDTLALSGPGSE